MNKRLHRSKQNAILAGVCSGIAKYFNTDPSIVRIIVAILAFFTSGIPVVLIYILMAVILPEE